MVLKGSQGQWLCIQKLQGGILKMLHIQNNEDLRKGFKLYIRLHTSTTMLFADVPRVTHCIPQS